MKSLNWEKAAKRFAAGGFMKQMQVDRFEEGFAVLVDDDEKTYDVPREFFGFELHAGDVLEVEMEGERPVHARFLAEETESRRALARALMQKLKKKS